MRPSAVFIVLICGAGVVAGSVLAAPEQQTWPWKDKAPVDPALALLTRVDTLSVAITEQTLGISVEAQAPTPGFTEVKLTPRIGSQSDKVFAFDVRGRRPQEPVSQVLTPVSIDMTYPDAPIASIIVVEVYAQENCKAFSLMDKTEVDCTMNPGSQQAP